MADERTEVLARAERNAWQLAASRLLDLSNRYGVPAEVYAAVLDAVRLFGNACDAAAEARGVAQGGDLLERAWLVIANAHGGDWSRATPEWREAATAWRDAWHRGCCTPALIPFGDVCEDCPHRTTPPATGATARECCGALLPPEGEDAPGNEPCADCPATGVTEGVADA